MDAKWWLVDYCDHLPAIMGAPGGTEDDHPMECDPDSLMLIDGATGTELDSRGVDLALPLWSARALLDAPEVVEQIHIDYLNAGCDAITTNTFRTHQRSLEKGGLGDRAEELTKLAVDIAKSARDKARAEALVMGCVSPLEDCYHPELSPSADECRTEHGRMMTTLLDAGVDYLMIETVNTRHEAQAAAETAHRLAGGKWMINFCMKTYGPPGVLLHGPPMVDVLPLLTEAYAVGVNCMSPETITPQVQLLRTLLPEKVRISAYGNIGYLDDGGEWQDRSVCSEEQYADHVQMWIDAGVSIIGGCCGTSPKVMRAVANRLGKTGG